jgi:hypothetical protein
MNPPIKIPPRPSSKSHDDLPALSAMDATEARLRAAKLLADEEALRADKLEKELATLKAAQPIIPSPIIPIQKEQESEKNISISPQAVTIRGKHWKFAIPITMIVALFPLIFTLVSDYMQMKRDFKTQTDTYAAQAKRIEEVNTYAHEIAKSNEELRVKFAEMSGYLSSVFQLANIKVTKTDPGAAFVNVVSDPLPIGAKRITPVIIRTPIPAPKNK